MAYQAKHRDPLFDSSMQAMIEKRGKELIGIGLLIFALMVTALLASYAPEDPSFFSATDAPVQNWLGRFGAALAAPIFIIVGLGSWAVPLIAAVWGARFVFHRGQESAIARLVFAPIAVALLAVYCSALAPGATWTHDFGLGGLFGDTILGALLNILPISASFGVKLLALPLFAGALAMLLFVCGATMEELRWFGRFLLVGVVLMYAGLTRMVGASAKGAVSAAHGIQQRRVAWREAQEEAALIAEGQAAELPRQDFTPQPLAIPREPVVTNKPERAGIFAQVTNLVKRAPEPEPFVEGMDEPLEEGAPDEDRIKARIASAIRSRAKQPMPARAAAPIKMEPPVVRPKGPTPLVVPKAIPPAPMAMLDEEPVLEAAPLAVPPAPEPAAVHAPAYAPESDHRAVVHHPAPKRVAPSRQARAEAQPALQFEDRHPGFELPPLSLLSDAVAIPRDQLSDEALEENARMLEVVLDDYGVKGEIVSVRPGPVVTMYELEPAPGLKASRVIGLADDIARSMSALSARVSTVPGRSVIGIELPNATREKVMLREILASTAFGDSQQRLPLALGKDIGGEPVVSNLAKMPHLLIAGTTGSGKSVAINTMILSLLYRLTPEECRLIMIDPKMLELSVYDGIPHLLSPVVTDPKKAVVALKWVVGEMEDRYRKMSKMGVRNIEGYNSRVKDALSKGEMFSRTVQTGFDDDTGEPVFETEEFAPEAVG